MANDPSTQAQPQELSVDDAIRLAIRMQREDATDAAGELYRRILAVTPEHPDALHYYGVLRHQCGHTSEAIDLIKRAVELAPDYAEAYNNLGNIQQHAGRSEAAEVAFRRVLELRPDEPGVLNNLGVALKNQGRYDEAVQVLQRAVDIDPIGQQAIYNLGNVYRSQGKYHEALEWLERAVDLNPESGEGYRSIGTTFYCLGMPELALTAYRKWLAIAPDNPVARHMVAACSGEDVPDRGSDDYVRRIFDNFADSFDAQLVKHLKYQAPKLLGDAVAEVLGDRAGRRELDALDAGCGTGLGGPHLRPHARRLIGVDLSPRMLQRAEIAGHYDQLDEAELTACLRQFQHQLDIVYSADTLCYFGRLDEVTEAAASALRPNGLLAFTVEALPDDATDDFRLEMHGRYAHSAAYIRRTLIAAGYELLRLDRAELRLEKKQPVIGHLVVARKP